MELVLNINCHVYTMHAYGNANQFHINVFNILAREEVKMILYLCLSVYIVVCVTVVGSVFPRGGVICSNHGLFRR